MTDPSADASPRWPAALVTCTAIYYLLSGLTLPFANTIWVGEIPALGLIQLPKSVLKSAVHEALLHAMNGLGLSRGSFSPDYIATHGWAMGLMVTAPVLLLIVLLTCLRGLPRQRLLIAALLICACFDAVVTLWFDSVSHLRLYNASYF